MGTLLDMTIARIGQELAAMAAEPQPMMLTVATFPDPALAGEGDVNDPNQPLGPTGEWEPVPAGPRRSFVNGKWIERS